MCAGHDVMCEARRGTGLASGRCECGSRALDGEENKQAQTDREGQGGRTRGAQDWTTDVRTARVCRSPRSPKAQNHTQPERARARAREEPRNQAGNQTTRRPLPLPHRASRADFWFGPVGQLDLVGRQLVVSSW